MIRENRNTLHNPSTRKSDCREKKHYCKTNLRVQKGNLRVLQVSGGGRTDLPMTASSTNGTAGERRTTPTDSIHHGHHHGHHHGAPTSNGHQFGGSAATTNGDQSQLQMYDVK